MEIFRDVNLLEIGDMVGRTMSNTHGLTHADSTQVKTNATSEALELASRAAERRRRDVRAARDKLGVQFQELKSVLSCRDKGSELTAKSQANIGKFNALLGNS